MAIAALVLAAGASTRMKQSKQLLDWGDKPLLRFVLDKVLAWPVDETWVVLGHEADRILEEVDLTDVSVVVNDDYADGLSTSLRVGIDAISRHSKAEWILIAMGDQPEIDGAVVRQLTERSETSERPVLVPKYRYTWSNPVLVATRLWPRLMALEGDQGAQHLFKSHAEWVQEVWVEALPPRDVDTLDDVEDLRPRSSV